MKKPLYIFLSIVLFFSSGYGLCENPKSKWRKYKFPAYHFYIETPFSLKIHSNTYLKNNVFYYVWGGTTDQELDMKVGLNTKAGKMTQRDLEQQPSALFKLLQNKGQINFETKNKKIMCSGLPAILAEGTYSSKYFKRNIKLLVVKKEKVIIPLTYGSHYVTL